MTKLWEGIAPAIPEQSGGAGNRPFLHGGFAQSRNGDDPAIGGAPEGASKWTALQPT